MASEMVEFETNGGTTAGYLSVPATGEGPGIVVIQEWWGLVPHIRDVADRFAAAGFVALAPDLYHGRATTSPDEAGKLMMALDIAQVEKDLRGAIQFLRAHPAVTSNKIGTEGFCMGGALDAERAGRRVRRLLRRASEGALRSRKLARARARPLRGARHVRHP